MPTGTADAGVVPSASGGTSRSPPDDSGSRRSVGGPLRLRTPGGIALLIGLLAVVGVAAAFVLVPLRSDLPVFGAGESMAGRYCDSAVVVLTGASDPSSEAERYGFSETCREAARGRVLGAGILLAAGVALYTGGLWALRGRTAPGRRHPAHSAPSRPDGAVPLPSRGSAAWLVGIALGSEAAAAWVATGTTGGYWMLAVVLVWIALACATIAVRRGTGSRWLTLGAVVAIASGLAALALTIWGLPSGIAVVVAVLLLYRRPSAVERPVEPPVAAPVEPPEPVAPFFAPLVPEPEPEPVAPPAAPRSPLEPVFVVAFILYAIATPVLGLFSLVALMGGGGEVEGWLFIGASLVAWLLVGASVLVSRRKGRALGWAVGFGAAACIAAAVVALGERVSYCVMESCSVPYLGFGGYVREGELWARGSEPSGSASDALFLAVVIAGVGLTLAAVVLALRAPTGSGATGWTTPEWLMAAGAVALTGLVAATALVVPVEQARESEGVPSRVTDELAEWVRWTQYAATTTTTTRPPPTTTAPAPPLLPPLPLATDVAAELSAVGVDLAWTPVEPGPGDPFSSAASGRIDAVGGVGGTPRVGWVAVFPSVIDAAAYGETRARELSDSLVGEGHWTWYQGSFCGRISVAYATGYPDEATRDAAAPEREALAAATRAGLIATGECR